ncbi:MAG TPA: response regulator [Abditibacterium sp.]
MKILFVEDNLRFVRVAAGQFLKSHEIINATSVAQGLEQLEQQVFEVVLIDYDLPDGKGDAIAAIASKLTKKPFIVAVSSHEMGNIALRKAGANAICSKMNFSAISSILERGLSA